VKDSENEEEEEGEDDDGGEDDGGEDDDQIRVPFEEASSTPIY